MQWRQPVLNGDRVFHPAYGPCVMHIGTQTWRDIRRDADAAMPARGEEGHRHVILARKLTEIGATGQTLVDRAGQIARRVLHAHDVFVLRQARHRFNAHVNDTASGNVVNDDWNIDRISDRGVVQKHPLLRRLVIIWRHDQRRVRAGFLGVTGQFDRFFGAVGSGAGNDRHAALRHFDRDFNDPAMLVMRQGRAFAGGSHGDQPLSAFVDLPFNEFGVGFFVNRPVFSHGGDQRDE